MNAAYSDTMQQCYGYGALSGKVGLNGSVSTTAPGAGIYTAAIICGGTENIICQALDDDVTYLGLAANPPSTAAGVPVTLTATITNAGTPAPTGAVSFYYGPLLLGSSTVNSQGVAVRPEAAPDWRPALTTSPHGMPATIITRPPPLPRQR